MIVLKLNFIFYHHCNSYWSSSLIIGFRELDPENSSILFLILRSARLSNFSLHYLSSLEWILWQFYYRVPYFWSIWIFLAMIDLAFPSFGSGRMSCRPGEVPNILFLINFLSFVKLPFGPSISDSRKINLPFMLPWSNNLSTNNSNLSKATSWAIIFNDSSVRNNFGYWEW